MVTLKGGAVVPAAYVEGWGKMKRKRRIIFVVVTAVYLTLCATGCGKTTTVHLVDLEKTPTSSEIRTAANETNPQTEAAVKKEASAPKTGTGSGAGADPSQGTGGAEETEPVGNSYILNTSSKKIHAPDCGAVKKMADKNRAAYTGTFDELVGMGYSPCGICNPN